MGKTLIAKVTAKGANHPGSRRSNWLPSQPAIARPRFQYIVGLRSPNQKSPLTSRKSAAKRGDPVPTPSLYPSHTPLRRWRRGASAPSAARPLWRIARQACVRRARRPHAHVPAGPPSPPILSSCRIHPPDARPAESSQPCRLPAGWRRHCDNSAGNQVACPALALADPSPLSAGTAAAGRGASGRRLS